MNPQVPCAICAAEWSLEGAKAHTYANGNIILEDNADLLTSYSWDLENRVTGVALPAGGLNTMVYDGDGKRRRYADSVMLRNFIWDGENIARQTDVNGATERE